MRILASLLQARERIANLLTWLINQKSLGLGEERKHERVVPRNQRLEADHAEWRRA